MRIVGSESPSLPPLDPLPPSNNSWALQVENEEAARFHIKEKLCHRNHTADFSDCGKERSGRSLKWADSGSRESSHGCSHAGLKANFKLCQSSDQASVMKSCDGSWRQAMSSKQHTRRQEYSPAQRKYCTHEKIRSSDFPEAGRTNENKISASRKHRSHQYAQSRGFMGNKVAEMASRSCYLSSQSSDNLHSKQSQRERRGGTQAAGFSSNTGLVEHGRILDVKVSDEKGDLKCGYHGSGTRDVKLADYARFAKPSQAEDNKKKWHNSWTSSNEALRRSRGSFHREAKNESNQGIGEFKLRARSHVEDCKHGKDEGCIQAAGHEAESRIDKYADDGVKNQSGQVSALIDKKCRSFDATSRSCQERTGDEGFDTNLSRAAAGRSNTLTEVQRDNMQETRNLSDNMLEVSSRDGAEAKGDPSETDQQYKMLASLLLDDSLDIGQEFDVTLTSEGPDLGFCGSIFDDDFEIPVSMDAEDVAHIKDTESVKKEPMPNSESADFRGPHLCVMRSLFQDGKNVMKHTSTSTNKHGKEFNVLRDTASQSAEKHWPTQSSPKMKPSPRVFVDVTNKFEIYAPPVTKEIQENDSHRLNQRQKQVEFGKNTLGYERYCELVPRCKRKPQDPQTPNPKQICSKRSWDGQIRKWRRLLHVYDLPTVDGEERAEDFCILKLRQGHAAASKQDNTRISEWIEIKDCDAREVKKIKEDASLSIYEDWIVS